MSKVVTRIQTHYDELFQSVQTLIEAQMQKEIDLIEYQRSHQKEQTKLLSICEQQVSPLELSNALIDLSTFNQESQILVQFDEIKKIHSKNLQCLENLESEGEKIFKDFQHYLLQLFKYMGSEKSELLLKTQTRSNISQASKIKSEQDVSLWGSVQGAKHNTVVIQPSYDTPEPKRVRQHSQSPSIIREPVPLNHDQFDWRFGSGRQQDDTFGIPKREMATLQSNRNSTHRKLQTIDGPTSPQATQRINDITKYHYESDFLVQKNVMHQNQQLEKKEQVEDFQSGYSPKFESQNFRPYQGLPQTQVQLRYSSVNKNRVSIKPADKKDYQPNSVQKMILSGIIGEQDGQHVKSERIDSSEQRIFQSQQSRQSPQKEKDQFHGRVPSSQSVLLESQIILHNDRPDYQSYQKEHSPQKSQKSNQSQLMQSQVNSQYQSNQFSSQIPTPQVKIDLKSVRSDTERVIYASKCQLVETNLGQQFSFKAHSNSILDIIFQNNSPVTISEESIAKFWNMDTGKQINKIQVNSEIGAFQIFQDRGQYFIAIGGVDGSLNLFQQIKDSWKKIQTIKDIKSPVSKIYFHSSLNSNIFVFFLSGQFAIYNWLSGEMIHSSKVHEGDHGEVHPMPIYCCFLQSQLITKKLRYNLAIAGGKSTGYVSLWSCDTKDLAFQNDAQFKAHAKPVYQIWVTDSIITSSLFDTDIKFWDPLNYTLQLTIREQLPILRGYLLSQSLYIVTWDKDKEKSRITLWELGQLDVYQQLAYIDGKVVSLQIQNKILCLGNNKGNLIGLKLK